MSGSNNGLDRQSIPGHRTTDIALQFPALLDSGELEQVRQRVDRITHAIEELRRYPLANADEPAPVFRALGKEQP